MATRLVLLLALLSCASAGSWFADFTTGIKIGRETELDCAQDPSACLKTIGRGLGLMTSEEWSSTFSVVKNLGLAATPLSQYFKGFLLGLQSNPQSSNMCTSLIANWIELIGTLSPSQIEYLTTLELIEAGCSIFYQLRNEIFSACNLGQLFNDLRYLNMYDYLKAYLRQNCALNSAITNVKNCQEDYYECGFSSGIILRLETGWSVDQQP